MSSSSQNITGLITDDPLNCISVGSTLNVEPVTFGGSDAEQVPDGVLNWTYFEGALLSFVLKDKYKCEALGSAVMIAPGLAVSASHIFRDRVSEILEGTAALLLAAPTTAGCDLWHVRKISSDDKDIAYLSLELASPISAGWRISTIPLSTRVPESNESVHVLGFRFDDVETNDVGLSLVGDLYAAAGQVTDVHYPIWDTSLMPFPVLEIACGSLGAMSGGAVLDGDGFLLGTICTGLEVEDGKGPTFAAWIIGGLNRQLEIDWPPSLYSCPIHLMDIDDRLLRIDGRDRIDILNADTYTYRFDR